MARHATELRLSDKIFLRGVSDFLRRCRYTIKTKMSDFDLLRQYSENGSEEAFAILVNRHLNLVYATALRQVRSPQLAEEVAQSVFMSLARNSKAMKHDT